MTATTPKHTHTIIGRLTDDVKPQVNPRAPAKVTIRVDDGDTIEYCTCLFWGDLAEDCLELIYGDDVEVKVRLGISSKYRGEIRTEYTIKAYRRLVDGKPDGEWEKEIPKPKPVPEKPVVDDGIDKSFL